MCFRISLRFIQIRGVLHETFDKRKLCYQESVWLVCRLGAAGASAPIFHPYLLNCVTLLYPYEGQRKRETRACVREREGKVVFKKHCNFVVSARALGRLVLLKGRTPGLDLPVFTQISC